jgi:hypothetical protein
VGRADTLEQVPGPRPDWRSSSRLGPGLALSLPSPPLAQVANLGCSSAYSAGDKGSKVCGPPSTDRRRGSRNVPTGLLEI